MTLVSTGNTHNAANPSTTRGDAKPDSFTERPKRVSSGTLLCMRIAVAKANGLATHTASTTRALGWAASLEHSTPATARRPRMLTRPPAKLAHGPGRRAIQA